MNVHHGNLTDHNILSICTVSLVTVQVLVDCIKPNITMLTFLQSDRVDIVPVIGVGSCSRIIIIYSRELVSEHYVRTRLHPWTKRCGSRFRWFLSSHIEGCCVDVPVFWELSVWVMWSIWVNEQSTYQDKSSLWSQIVDALRALRIASSSLFVSAGERYSKAEVPRKLMIALRFRARDCVSVGGTIDEVEFVEPERSAVNDPMNLYLCSSAGDRVQYFVIFELHSYVWMYVIGENG